MRVALVAARVHPYSKLYYQQVGWALPILSPQPVPHSLSSPVFANMNISRRPSSPGVDLEPNSSNQSVSLLSPYGGVGLPRVAYYGTSQLESSLRE
jgi:hypothetical protein